MPRKSETIFDERTLKALVQEAGGDALVRFDAGHEGLGIRFRGGRGRFFAWWRKGASVKRSYLGAWPALTIKDARRAASIELGKVALGGDPIAEKQRQREAERAEKAAPKATVEARFKVYIAEKRAEGLRTVDQTEQLFKRHILPAWGERKVLDITRGNVRDLLDGIAERNQVTLADGKKGPNLKLHDKVLAYARGFLLWHARRFDHPAPLLSKLRRLKPAASRREHSLNDDEIRLMFATAEAFEPAAFGAFMRLLLVTGQRRIEVAGMRREEIDGNGLWVIPAARFKGKREHAVPLSQMARDIISAAPKLHPEFVLSAGRSRVSGLVGFDKWKRDFDAAMLERARNAVEETGGAPAMVKLRPYKLHDLRRTARSLLSRAGVRPDIAERYIGHAVDDLTATYDRHSFGREKREAADALAAILARIICGQAADVIELGERRAAAPAA